MAIFFLTSSAVITAEEWEERAELPGGPRHHPVGWNLDGNGYVLTGTAESLGSLVLEDDFYRYHPEDDEWETLDDFPGPARSFSIGIEYDGKGYIGFGMGPGQEHLDDLWRYDPESEEWEELTPCPCDGRRHPVLEAQNGRIFAGLGDEVVGQSIEDLDDWWAYDIEDDEWEQMDDLPGPARHHPFHFSIGYYVYAGMGHSGPTIFDDWYRFDTEVEEWEQMEDFPGQARVAGTQFAHQGLGYVLSGDGSDHSYMEEGEFWRYYPEEDEWEELPPHPGTSRWAPTSFAIGNEVFFHAGQDRADNDQLHNDLWAYEMSMPTPLANFDEDPAQYTLYPNPAENRANIEISSELDRPVQVALYNMNGKELENASPEEAITPGETIELDVENLNAGIYMVRVHNDQYSENFRLQVQ